MILHLRAQGLEEGDEHMPTLSCIAWSTLPLHTLPLHTAVESIYLFV